MRAVHLLVVGIGNPAPYALTRHSVGNVLIESFAKRCNVRLTNDRGGETAETATTVGDVSVRLTLFKSKAFMNLSGPPVARTLRGLALQPTHLVVLHDSLAHKTLAVSPKDGGSPNGHNGLRSIISALGTQSFHRIRLGIGKNEVDAAEYVMEKISPAERASWGENGPGVEQAWKAVERLAVKLAQP